jgi:hypothetical protein
MAYEFTASSDRYLSVADNAALDITGALTLAAWVKSSGNYGAIVQGIIAKFNSGTSQRSYAITITSTGLVQVPISSNGTSNYITTGVTAIGTNWRHIAFTYNPSTRTEIFLDGASNANRTDGVIGSVLSGSADLWLGVTASTNPSPNNFYFNGLIAEVGIYSTNLSTAEVASLARGMTCDKVRPQSLVAYFPLIRDLTEIRGGLAVTNNNGATVANHPRVYA